LGALSPRIPLVGHEGPNRPSCIQRNSRYGPGLVRANLVRRHLLHSLQRKQGPKVDAGTRNWMPRVIGRRRQFEHVSKRTVTKMARARWATVLRPATLSNRQAEHYIDPRSLRDESPSLSRKAATQRTVRLRVLIPEWIGNGRDAAYAQTRSKEAGHRDRALPLVTGQYPVTTVTRYYTLSLTGKSTRHSAIL
jgi:hypothetical protein